MKRSPVLALLSGLLWAREKHREVKSIDPASLVLAERMAPRHTRYPIAPHFFGEIGDRQMRDWLDALAPEASLSLYVHIPFCKEICAFCGCHTKALQQDAPLAAYKENLLRELESIVAATPARRVDSIHLGGGRPGILGPSPFAEISKLVRDRFLVVAWR